VGQSKCHYRHLAAINVGIWLILIECSKEEEPMATNIKGEGVPTETTGSVPET